MAFCSRCGVEVETRAKTCPLCEAPIQRLDEPPAEAPRYPEVIRIPGWQMRYLVWLVSTAALLSTAFTVLMLDLVLNRRVSWSLYPLTGAGVLWLFITVVVIFARRPIFVIAGQAAATAGFLVVIDLLDGRLEWFLPLALPVVGVVTGASFFVWLVIRRSRRSLALVTAAVLFTCGVGSVALDLLISAHLGAANLSWSFIVLGAVVPLLVFLLYFHYRLGQRIDLARVLHT